MLLVPTVKNKNSKFSYSLSFCLRSSKRVEASSGMCPASASSNSTPVLPRLLPHGMTGLVIPHSLLEFHSPFLTLSVSLVWINLSFLGLFQFSCLLVLQTNVPKIPSPAVSRATHTHSFLQMRRKEGYAYARTDIFAYFAQYHGCDYIVFTETCSLQLDRISDRISWSCFLLQVIELFILCIILRLDKLVWYATGHGFMEKNMDNPQSLTFS